MVKHLVRVSHGGRRHAAALLVFAAASTSAPALADEATSIVATIRPLHSLVAGVTSHNLRQAARRYLNPERYVLGVLSPAPSDDGEVAGGASDPHPPSEVSDGP